MRTMRCINNVNLLLFLFTLLNERTITQHFQQTANASVDEIRCKMKLTDQEYERLFPAHFDKFVFPTSGGCAGLGNQMFRFAALYGIGKPYGRKPIYKESQKCTTHDHGTEGGREKEMLFPVFARQEKYFNPAGKQNQIFYIKNGFIGCFAYEDPQKFAISRIKQKYLEMDGEACLQSYKYFESRRTEIRQIFQFGHQLCRTVMAFKKELFGNDQTHKFCVHTRTGDIVRFGWGSKKDFTEKGIEFGFEYLRVRNMNRPRA
ncbi:hypothetical protein niasHT_026312 [Heterodera trifolii]|uniref:Uncharacterized protein n=1 Tax=Heterodera trifolii TaxID=157864 RepID=A0ABD2K0B9_9BILA